LHIFHPEESDWYPSSEKPAIAMSVFKDYHPDLAIPFATDLQYALHEEGRDLTDDEAYRHLLPKYEIPDQEFYTRLRSVEYRQKAYEEFALVKQLKVSGFPTLFLQVSASRLYLLSRGIRIMPLYRQVSSERWRSLTPKPNDGSHQGEGDAQRMAAAFKARMGNQG